MTELETMQRREWPAWLIIVIWLGLVALAFCIDGALASHIARRDAAGNAIGVISKYGTLAKVMRLPGEAWPTTLLIAVALCLFHPWKWGAGGLLVLTAAMGGLIYSILKWTVGRPRPQYNAPYAFDFFKGGLTGFITADKLSFPSGHTILAFSTAACLALCLPRWRWVFYALASVTAADRVLENSHYLADVIAAAGLGVVSRNLTLWLVSLFMQPQAAAPVGSQGFEVVPDERPDVSQKQPPATVRANE